MVEELRNIIESARSRLQAELDAQLEAVARQHEQAVAEARRAAGVEVEERWSAKLRAAEHQAGLQADEGRRRAATQLEEARAVFEAEREAERNAAMNQPPAPSTGSLLAALRRIDEAGSISHTLAAMVQAAAAEAPRAAVFIVNGDHLDEWDVAGIPTLTRHAVTISDPSAGIIGLAAREGTTARAAGDGSPGFAALPQGRSGLAIPLILDGDAVAVLYGDEGNGVESGSAWADVLDVVARHGVARLGYLTALRTAQAMRWLSGGVSPAVRARATDVAMPTSDEEEQAARRYARLLVSEIKLYNESPVRLGREHRDLSRRLQPEIERARRLYDERVPETLPGRANHFHNELVQTLAGGDASLLG